MSVLSSEIVLSSQVCGEQAVALGVSWVVWGVSVAQLVNYLVICNPFQIQDAQVSEK